MELDIFLIVILIVVFILFSVANYFVFPEIIKKIRAAWATSDETITSNLESLFVQEPKKVASRLKWGCVILLTIVGFWLPASFSGLDKVILDNAVRLNKQALYDESIFLLSGLAKGSSPLLHNELGVAYLGVNDVDAAVRNFKKAIEILPEYARAHANLAVAYRQLDKNEDAEFQNRRAEDYFRSNLDENLIYGEELSSNSGLMVRFFSAFVFFIISLKSPKWLTNFLRHRREKKYNNQLGDSLKMLSNSLKAGMSLLQSIEMMVDQSHGVVKQEFELVLKEHQLGLSIGDALANLKTRIPVEDNVMLVDTVALLTETGGDIPHAIENVVHTISERKRISDKISAMTAEGKVQTIILFTIPFFIGWFMNVAQKESFSLMYTTVIGWICMIVMFVWGLLGLFFMIKITQVKI